MHGLDEAREFALVKKTKGIWQKTCRTLSDMFLQIGGIPMAESEPERRFSRWPDTRFDRRKAHGSKKGKTCLIIESYAHVQFGQALTDEGRQRFADSPVAVAFIYNQEGLTQSTTRNGEQANDAFPVHGQSDTGIFFGKQLRGQTRKPVNRVSGDAPISFLTGKPHQSGQRFS